MAGTIMWPDFHKHPAVKAWNELRPESTLPKEIEVLKIRQKQPTVYRLSGFGSGGSSIIAKRCGRKNALVERTIYEEILPHLPISSLRYFGFVEEPDGEFCWQFVEDAGEEKYSRNIEEHRTPGARWLGLMHTSAAHVAKAVTLPDRGPSWYLRRLRSARARIRQALDSTAPSDNDVARLTSLVSQCNSLESRWEELAESCDGAPSTLVHADFVAENVRVRNNPKGVTLLPFDWGTAGWGMPARDLVGLDVAVYHAEVQYVWPRLDIETIRHLAKLGEVCRLIAAVHHASKGLPYFPVEKVMGWIPILANRE
jgi:hypothetical protein